MEEEKIRALVKAEGAVVCGFASISSFTSSPPGFSPVDVYPATRTVIVHAVVLPKGLFDTSSRLIYGHFNADVCHDVDMISLRSAQKLEELYPCHALPLPCDGPYDAWNAETLHGHGILSMKHLAVQAGLGQLGKNTILLNPRYGNRLVIGAILTDLALMGDPPSESICIPSCHKCLDSCPVHAIENGVVEQKACRLTAYGTTERGFPTVEYNKCRRLCPMRFGL